LNELHLIGTRSERGPADVLRREAARISVLINARAVGARAETGRTRCPRASAAAASPGS
jgi:hypothetical protein